MRTEASPPSTCRVGATRGSRGRRIFLSHETPLECDAGNPDPVLSPLPIPTEGDAGRGRDFEGVRPGGIGPSPGPGRSRSVRRRGRRTVDFLHGPGDAIPRDEGTDPDNPRPPRAAQGPEEGLNATRISQMTRLSTAVYGGFTSVLRERIVHNMFGSQSTERGID